ncbi:MAG: hypothetical protein Q8O97_03715 [bacterium]|nr:hypothetical protein [bacterium]
MFPSLLTTLTLNLKYPTFGGFDITASTGILGIIAWAYALIVGISGFAAFVMIVWGGVEWLSSAGNPSSMNSAKDKIKSALLGLLLVLASFLIIQIINPDLVGTLSLPSL